MSFSTTYVSRILLIGFWLGLLGCQSDAISVKSSWTSNFPTLGTFSSIKCTDLNQDGIKDIVIGAGKNEFEESDSAVVAINGADGTTLWSHPGKDQMVGTAVFADMNDDKVSDIIIGGRQAQLKVLDGQDGSEIWSFKIKHNDYDAKGYMRFNFFNPQLLDDLTDDDIPELLVSNGGNIRAYKKDGSDRYPGVIGILDGASGDIIAVDTMPDGQETYMSPVIYEGEGDDGPWIIYGSGGETMSGHLYKTTLSDLLASDISQSSVLATREGHGFIAPVCIADINDDGAMDIIANWHGGEMMAVDGHTDEVLWSHAIDNSELNCSPTPGDATGDGIPDFFSQFTLGAWPKSIGSIQVLIDGATGQPIYKDTTGCVGFSSALSYDLDHDGRSEFIYSINDHNCTGIYLGMTKYSLEYYNHTSRKKEILYPPRSAKNIGSTPWVGDLDGDDELDLIVCLQGNYNDIYSYYGIQISHLDFNTTLSQHPCWTEYMGDQGKGVYQQ